MGRLRRAPVRRDQVGLRCHQGSPTRQCHSRRAPAHRAGRLGEDVARHQPERAVHRQDRQPGAAAEQLRHEPRVGGRSQRQRQGHVVSITRSSRRTVRRVSSRRRISRSTRTGRMKRQCRSGMRGTAGGWTSSLSRPSFRLRGQRRALSTRFQRRLRTGKWLVLRNGKVRHRVD